MAMVAVAVCVLEDCAFEVGAVGRCGLCNVCVMGAFSGNVLFSFVISISSFPIYLSYYYVNSVHSVVIH